MFETVGRRVDVDAQRRRLLSMLSMIGIAGAAVGTLLLATVLHVKPPRTPEPLEAELVLIEVADPAPEGPPDLPAPAPRGGGAPAEVPPPAEAPPDEVAPLDAVVPTEVVDAADVDPADRGAGTGPEGPVGPPCPPGTTCTGGPPGGGGGGDGSGIRTFHPSEVTAKRRVMPDYPEAARQMNLGDQACRARLFIDERGVPYEVGFEGCPEVFHASARDALLKWRFYPAVVGGGAVKAQFLLNVKYVAN